MKVWPKIKWCMKIQSMVLLPAWLIIVKSPVTCQQKNISLLSNCPLPTRPHFTNLMHRCNSILTDELRIWALSADIKCVYVLIYYRIHYLSMFSVFIYPRSLPQILRRRRVHLDPGVNCLIRHLHQDHFQEATIRRTCKTKTLQWWMSNSASKGFGSAMKTGWQKIIPMIPHN